MDNTCARKPGGGRKPSKPEYSAAKNLAQQMKAAADLYTDKMSLQAIADALALNPIKVRKLLITAGVYESDTAKLVRQTFNMVSALVASHADWHVYQRDNRASSAGY